MSKEEMRKKEEGKGTYRQLTRERRREGEKRGVSYDWRG